MHIITEQQEVAEVSRPGEWHFLLCKKCSPAWNLQPGTSRLVREALGYQDALYGFKSGFDPASGASSASKAGGYWPNNVGERHRQPPVLDLFV